MTESAKASWFVAREIKIKIIVKMHVMTQKIENFLKFFRKNRAKSEKIKQKSATKNADIADVPRTEMMIFTVESSAMAPKIAGKKFFEKLR